MSFTNEQTAAWEDLVEKQKRYLEMTRTDAPRDEQIAAFLEMQQAQQRLSEALDGEASSKTSDLGPAGGGAWTALHLLETVLIGGWFDAAHPNPTERALQEAGLVCLRGAREALLSELKPA